MTHSPTELTTAATDAALALVCVAIVLWLLGARASWERGVWLWLFALTGMASVLGAIAHGLELADAVRDALWQPLYLSLGLAIALFVVAAVCDWRGEPAARRLLPWALTTGVAFYVVTLLLRGAFVVFIAYEAVAMLAALAIYVLLASRGVPGSVWLAAGVGLSVLAAVIQASSLRSDAIVPLDHNGLFHLVQIVGTVVLATGVRQALAAMP